MSTKRQSSKGKNSTTAIDDKETTNSYKSRPQKKTKGNAADTSAAKKNDDTDSTATTKEMEELVLGEWELISHTNHSATLALWVDDYLVDKPNKKKSQDDGTTNEEGKEGAKKIRSLRGELLFMDVPRSSGSSVSTLHVYIGEIGLSNYFRRQEVQEYRRSPASLAPLSNIRRSDDSACIENLSKGCKVQIPTENLHCGGPSSLTLQLLEDQRTLKVEYVNLKGLFNTNLQPDKPIFSFTGYRKGDRRKRTDRSHNCSTSWAENMERSIQEQQTAAKKARRERMENLGMELSEGGSDDSEIDCASDSSLVPPWMMDSNNGGGARDQDSSDEEEASDDAEEYDWSGRPGYRCNLCGRRSEGVGPRRGFDYENSVCGGCC